MPHDMTFLENFLLELLDKIEYPKEMLNEKEKLVLKKALLVAWEKDRKMSISQLVEVLKQNSGLEEERLCANQLALKLAPYAKEGIFTFGQYFQGLNAVSFGVKEKTYDLSTLLDGNDFKSKMLSHVEIEYINKLREKTFKSMISPYPLLSQFWDFDKNEVNIEGLKAKKNYLSEGEQILAGFFLLVWLHHEHADFPVSIIEVTNKLGQIEINMITKWMNNPFWP